ncbi:MAG: hypothetical protein CME40_01430 [Haliea sp.]|nr:hypothetical protein [Haliea sp.]|tara:strand:- start:58093 stop:58629 length:537 start_codon:yes stop_codon:yes gene_type:complete
MNASSPTDQTNPEAPLPMTPAKGLGVLLGIIVVVAGFIAINSALDVHEFWAGFLFLLYWAGIEHVAWDKLAACVVGSVVGLTLAWLLFALPGWFGEAGGFIFLGLILVVIYCQVMGWLPVAINLTTMLFLTAGTIPAVQEGVNFGDAFIALGLAFAYFIGLVWVGTRLMARKAAPQAA